MLFEDGYVAPDHLSWPDEILVLRVPLYGYVAREGSITRANDHSLQDVLDILSGVMHTVEVSRGWDESIQPLALWLLALCCRLLRC